MLASRPRLASVALAAGLAAPSSHGQTTTVVSGGGPALAHAVQAAQPGDTLLVRAARYDPIVVTRGIRILCDPGVDVGTPTQMGIIAVDVKACRPARSW